MIQINSVVNPGEDFYVLVRGEDPLHATIEKFTADEISINKEGIITYIDKSSYKSDVRITERNVIGKSFEDVSNVLRKLLNGELRWEELNGR